MSSAQLHEQKSFATIFSCEGQLPAVVVFPSPYLCCSLSRLPLVALAVCRPAGRQD